MNKRHGWLYHLLIFITCGSHKFRRKTELDNMSDIIIYKIIKNKLLNNDSMSSSGNDKLSSSVNSEISSLSHDISDDLKSKSTSSNSSEYLVNIKKIK